MEERDLGGMFTWMIDLDNGLLTNAAREGTGESILSPQIRSWVGDGPNLVVTDAQVIEVVGPEALTVIGEQTGADPAAVAGHLSEQLPVLIDAITPQGQITDDAALLQQAVTTFADTAPYDTPVKLVLGDAEYTSTVPQARIGMAAVRPAEFIILQFTQDMVTG